MQQPAQPYREEDGHILIEIRLETLAQLFNSLDPSPFISKDLDADAEDYIVGAMRELAPEKPVRLVIYLPPEIVPIAAGHDLTGTIHHYFAYRSSMAARDLRLGLSDARRLLAGGVVFLAVCLGIRQAVLTLEPSALRQLIAESLLIFGWVGLWRPIEAILYDWWPLYRRRRIFDRLSAIDVQIRPYGS